MRYFLFTAEYVFYKDIKKNGIKISKKYVPYTYAIFFPSSIFPPYRSVRDQIETMLIEKHNISTDDVSISILGFQEFTEEDFCGFTGIPKEMLIEVNPIHDFKNKIKPHHIGRTGDKVLPPFHVKK